MDDTPPPLGQFGKYLSLWVFLCIGIGTIIGIYIPQVPQFLLLLSYQQVSLPIAILIWIMIYPMTLRVTFDRMKYCFKYPSGILITTFLNWAVQPFLMFGYATLFFLVIYSSIFPTDLAKEYIAGAVILGGSPCTAMVFVWSLLSDGDPSYTLVQVALNDFLIFVFYFPTLLLFLSIANIPIPYLTVIFSIIIFVLLPFLAGSITRYFYLKNDNLQGLQNLENSLKPYTAGALLLTLVLIFTFQGEKIAKRPLDILLIIIPLTLQSYTVFALAFGLVYYYRVEFKIAAPATYVATSNFFELAVAVAISAFGPESGAVLVTVCGVLVEVPVMLSFVYLMNKNKKMFRGGDDGVSEVTRDEKLI